MRQLNRAYKNGYTNFLDFENKLLKIDKRVYRDKQGKDLVLPEMEKKVFNTVTRSEAYINFLEAHQKRLNL
jgi:hypothetical protein